MNTKEIGDFGENAVCEYLKKSGYIIVERNFHSRHGEIDIIALDNDCTVFIEVKTRKNAFYGNASEFVDFRKQKKIMMCANYYLRGDITREMRFDVVEVYYKLINNEPVLTKINHIKDAFIS